MKAKLAKAATVRKILKLQKENKQKAIKKVPPNEMFVILRNLFIFDLVMAALYMIVLYDSDNWDHSEDTNDHTFADKAVNRIYYALMISSTIGPPASFVPRSRTGKLLTIFHIYLSIMFLPFLLVAIIGVRLPFDWF